MGDGNIEMRLDSYMLGVVGHQSIRRWIRHGIGPIRWSEGRKGWSR